MEIDKNKVWVIDIESNALLADSLTYKSFPYKLKSSASLWCVVLRNIGTNEVVWAAEKNITKEWLKGVLHGATHLVAHNGIKFDFPMLKLFGILDYHIGWTEEPDTIFGQEIEIIDTIIWSRISNPDRFGGHGLEAWGKRLGNFKGDFKDFSKYSETMLEYCITPDHKVLRDDLRWIKADELKIGDRILGFDEYNTKQKNGGRRFKTAVVEIIEYDYKPVYEVVLSSGKKIKTTEDHKWLVAKGNHGSSSYGWVETKNLRSKKETTKYHSKIPRFFDVWEEDLSKEAGYLSGIFDGEACMSKNRFSISIAQRPTPTLHKIENLLNQKYKGVLSKRDVKANSDCCSIRLNSSAAKKLQFLGEIRPERLINAFSFEMLGRLECRLEKDEVLEVNYIGEQKIIKIQTSTRTFICEGYPMHNCQQDTNVNAGVFLTLLKEMHPFEEWKKAVKQENKLADLAVKRESLGFWFNKDKAIKCVEDLTNKMEEIEKKVNPLLPPKPMNKGELAEYLPAKTQFKSDGTPSIHIIRFAEKLGAKIEKRENSYCLIWEDKEFTLPIETPLKSTLPGDITNLDHVKMYLLSLRVIKKEFEDLYTDVEYE